MTRYAALGVYNARSGKLLADMKVARQGLRLVDWLYRINRACVHQSDGLRTMVSCDKSKMQA